MASEEKKIPVGGEEIAGKYRIERVIGQGGMGAVFSARNTLTGKRVAIKWLLPEKASTLTRERLLREAQLAGSIAHPNVVDIYDVGEHQGGLFLVMEYLHGRPLSELMIEKGRFEPRELIPLLVPAMRGVHAAHLAGVIHRDLKPENIILCEVDGAIIPKVVDFGVSKAVGVSAIPNSSLTRTGALVGTPHYMALEQIDGSSIVDPRTDVYAFGVLLYRCLTGTYPFDGSSLGEVILTIGTKEARSMRTLRPELPEELDAIVLRALSRDLQSRFGTLEELARAVMPFANPSAVATMHASAPASSMTTGVVSFGSLGVRGLEVSITHESRGGATAAGVAGADADERRRRMLIVATLALVPLIVGALVMRMGLPSWLASFGLGPSADVTRAPERARPPAASPARAPDVADVTQTTPALAAPANSDSVASEAPSTGATDEKDKADSSGSEQGKRAAGVRRRESSAGEAPGAASGRGSDGRELIPGKRTNGLSVDDF